MDESPNVLRIPELSLVVLIGPSSSGKSSFARKHFKPTEVLSSDFCRALIADDENDMSVTPHAFSLLHEIAGRRLAQGKLTVVDATSVQSESRQPLVAIAREYHCLPVAIVFDLPERLCQERNRLRPERNLPEHVIRNHHSQMRRSRRLEREGFRHVFTFRSVEEVDAAVIERVPLWNNRKSDHGPFDIIGDVHGCADELEQLLNELGYVPAGDSADALWPGAIWAHPAGRKAVFVGDLVDRGPRVLDCLRIVRNMIVAGHALCVPGNHDIKLMRRLNGKNVQITHGLEQSLAEIESLPEEFRATARGAIAEFLDSLVSHFVLDDGRLVVAHAGMKAEMQGRGSGKVREFALFGETTGETDEFGLPVRYNWAAEYRGPAMVVYGHTPVPEPEWINRTVNIDTGCVFGGKLTALKYPEREFISVPAARTYSAPSKPFLPVNVSAPPLSAQQMLDDLLDLEDVLGKRSVSTRLGSNITIREENAIAALEVMSRFAANPKWLIYLPPTISPSETSKLPDYLEYPTEAFSYYRAEGVGRVICEEKHMGSRAVVICCRDAEVARRRFGVADGADGVVLTRTGRRFFDDGATESGLLDVVRRAMTAGELWNSLNTDWICLDCELMPWSAKAQALLRQQYAAVGTAARVGLNDVQVQLARAAVAGIDVAALSAGIEAKKQDAADYIAAYRRYCWQVDSIADLKLAPFHIMATEGRVHVSRDHAWHMEQIREICDASDGVFHPTRTFVVDLTDPRSEASAVNWWLELTAAGGEGMVVKPMDFVMRGRRGLTQPAVKCRGREYLRIIYGPHYTQAANLERLRSRGLGRKRSLAVREFALGVEALERFVRREPLRRVHECVFGVLALESEPVDPRL